MNVEKLLNITADSQKMGDWGDSLSFLVNSSKGSIRCLSDDDLFEVAGGRAIIIKKKEKDKETSK